MKNKKNYKKRKKSTLTCLRTIFSAVGLT